MVEYHQQGKQTNGSQNGILVSIRNDVQVNDDPS